jgi:hypothetical protein
MSKRTTREVKLTTGGTSLELPPATTPPVQIRASMTPSTAYRPASGNRKRG